MQVTEEEEGKVIGPTSHTHRHTRTHTVKSDCLQVCRGNSLHALGRLPGDVDQLDHIELGLDDVKVVVEAGAFTPLGHYGQLRLGGVAHEQQDVHVTRFPGWKHTRVDETESCRCLAL